MARCKCPTYGPSQAYLVSFGDCMTALLAFFIVMNSLAEEQTGANLHSGTGSFNSALLANGLPGSFAINRSKYAQQKNAVAPMYQVGDPDSEEAGLGAGPDEIDEGRIIDREEEQFSRFLERLRQVSPAQKQKDIEGEVSIDILGTLPENTPLMTPEMEKTLIQIRAMLRQPDRSLEITVWATTPSQTAWTRAVRQANQLRDEAIELLQLGPFEQQRLTASGRTWISSKVKRPAASVVLRRLESSRAP